MIVPFAIDPDALLMEGRDLAERMAAHQRVLEAWRDVGVLVHAGPDVAHSELDSAIRALPQHVRKLWQEAVLHQRVRPAGDGWRPLCQLMSADEAASLRSEIEVGCLDDTRAFCLSVPVEEISLLVDGRGPELCRFGLADRAERFVTARRRAGE